MDKGTRKVGWWVGWLGVLGLVIWQAPHLRQAWDTNRMALAAMEVCVGTQALSVVVEASPFLQAGAARCVGEDEIAHARSLEALKSQNRVEILHAANPSDIELALLIVDTYPAWAEAYFWLGEAMVGGMYVWEVPPQTLAETEDLLEIIAVYEKGLELAPTNGVEWDNMGRLYQASQEWEKAAHAYDMACHLIGDESRSDCLKAGLVYMQLDLYEQALARYQDNLRLLPEYPSSSSLKGIAKALIALNRSQEAIPYLETLAAQGDVEAQTLLAQIQGTP